MVKARSGYYVPWSEGKGYNSMEYWRRFLGNMINVQAVAPYELDSNGYIMHRRSQDIECHILDSDPPLPYSIKRHLTMDWKLDFLSWRAVSLGEVWYG